MVIHVLLPGEDGNLVVMWMILDTISFEVLVVQESGQPHQRYQLKQSVWSHLANIWSFSHLHQEQRAYNTFFCLVLYKFHNGRYFNLFQKIFQLSDLGQHQLITSNLYHGKATCFTVKHGNCWIVSMSFISKLTVWRRDRAPTACGWIPARRTTSNQGLDGKDAIVTNGHLHVRGS